MFHAEVITMVDVILPYPFQLPQDYYAKNLPPTPAPSPAPEPPSVSPTPPPTTPNYGGIYYGDTPPDSPSYGWLWATTKGYLYVYIEPGVWQQIATNW